VFCSLLNLNEGGGYAKSLKPFAAFDGAKGDNGKRSKWQETNNIQKYRIFRAKGGKRLICLKVVKLRWIGYRITLSFLQKWQTARAKWLGDRESLVAFCST
jgi:hypothetical protein